MVKKITAIIVCLMLMMSLVSTNAVEADTGATVSTVVPIEVAAVTASSDDGNIPSNTVDSLLTTRWSAKGDGQWIKYDLGGSQSIGYIGIAMYKGDERATLFDILVSDDDVNWTEVYRGQSSGETSYMEAYDIDDVTARYVKVVGHGYVKNKDGKTGEWNSITEVHIFTPTADGTMPLSKLEELPVEEPRDITYSKPGLYDIDGSEHKVHRPNPVTGKILNVVDFGADVKDNDHSDTAAIEAAINAASAGDEVYFPNGVYNLKGTSSGFLLAKSGVNLRGQSEEGTVLMADIDDTLYTVSVIRILGQHDIKISHMTISSVFNGTYSTNHKENNPEAGKLSYGIYIEDNALKMPSYNITINDVTIEKFQRMGIRISKSHDVVVKDCTFRNATDVGGGGAGYGISIQGEGNGKNRLGYRNDSRFNVVEDCHFVGPYLRHGVIIQYYSHNNVIKDNMFENTRLDAIDLHGEDEYLNEVCGNTVKNVTTGAGVGIGNTGATHDQSGPYNYIHDNTFMNCREGIKVYLGSPNTIIEANIVKNCDIEGGKGIYLLNAPGTIVKDNKIYHNNSEDFYGILLAHDEGTNGKADNNPQNVQLMGNQVYDNTNGIRIEAGAAIVLSDNQVENNTASDLVDARTAQTRNTKVHSAEEITFVMQNAQPGDTVIMANGEWKDQHIEFECMGTRDNPITLRAETPGEVILTGSSTLRIAGEHLIVDGLYFKEGTPEEGAVVEFRNTTKDKVAHHSRLTNTTIAYYNAEDEKTDYKWVSLYGTYNRVDHCDFRGKNHSGALLVVWRDDDSAQYHRIDHNYFAYIPEFSGGNGAEAIRIGTSHQSLSDSFTTVEYNLFEQCNGETEVISNKSGNNTYRYNTFVDCEGTLTLRHGNNCTVEGNFIFGNHYYGTGGIRVIGENHKVINNYITGVAGDSGTYRSAICLTNGVPNSPLNRYFQVKNALIADNILVDNEKSIHIGAGKDQEKSLPPENCTFQNNIVMSSKAPLIHYVDIPIGITYEGNVVYGAEVGITPVPEGITVKDPGFVLGSDGLYRPQSTGVVALPGKPLTKNEVGPQWVNQKAAQGDTTFRVRNLFEEKYSQVVSVPWNDKDHVIVMSIGSSEAYVNNLKTKIDIKNQDVAPIVKSGRTLVPIRFIAEKFGAKVDWNGLTSTVTILLEDKIVRLVIGSDKMQVNGVETKLDVAAQVQNGRTLLPLRAVAEALGRKVHWDSRGIVILTEDQETLNRLTKQPTIDKIADLYRVIASFDDGNVPTNTIDDDLSTRWSADGDGQWIRYNLGSRNLISSVGIAFHKGDQRATYFDIEVSDDGMSWTKVYSGASSGTTSEMEMFDIDDVEASYVRIVGHMNTSNTWNSLSEVQVYSADGSALIKPLAVTVPEAAKPDTGTDEDVGNNGTNILPTDDAYVENGKPDQNFGTADKIRVKTNNSGSIVRVAYLKFKVDNATAVQSAIFRLSGKLSSKNPDGASFEYSIYGLTNDHWDENTITWNNSPNHAAEGMKVTGIGESAVLLGTITMSEKEKVKSYTLDVTDFVKSQSDGVVTLMIADTKVQDGNTDPYSKERKDETLRPVLIIQ